MVIKEAKDTKYRIYLNWGTRSEDLVTVIKIPIFMLALPYLQQGNKVNTMLKQQFIS